MFWSLLLSHFLADYPLQTNWMVKNKKHWWALTLHVVVHFLTMVSMILITHTDQFLFVLPYLLLLTVIHFVIDTIKNLESKYIPQWVIIPHLLDQLYHILSILLIANWIAQAGGSEIFTRMSLLIYLLAYLLVTHVAFITERVLVYKNKAYQQVVNQQMWPRMLRRAALLTGLLLIWNLSAQFIFASLIAGLDLSEKYNQRALLTDICIVLAIMGLVLLVSAF